MKALTRVAAALSAAVFAAGCAAEVQRGRAVERFGAFDTGDECGVFHDGEVEGERRSFDSGPLLDLVSQSVAAPAPAAPAPAESGATFVDAPTSGVEPGVRILLHVSGESRECAVTFGEPAVGGP